MPDRFFVDAIILSSSICLLSLNQIKSALLLKIYAAILFLVLSINQLTLIKKFHDQNATRDIKLIKCLKREEIQTYEEIYDKCNLYESFNNITKGKETSHPSIKIYNPPNYTKMLKEVISK